jgi:serine/threonine protein kinase
VVIQYVYDRLSIQFRAVLTKRQVAIKIVRPVSSSEIMLRVRLSILCLYHLTLMQKVRRELEVWSQLRHPNIVQLSGYTEANDTFGPLGAFVSPVSRSKLIRLSPLRSRQWHANGDAEWYLKEPGSSLNLEKRIIMVLML